jgi:hypothetical protein
LIKRENLQRSRITNYSYINLLVLEVQQNAAAGEPPNDSFAELMTIYRPLLCGIVNKITKRRIKMATPDVYTIILGLFYKLILRYDVSFVNTAPTGNVAAYTHVYFSTYLKNTLHWEIYRLTRPNKRETDNLEKAMPYMDITALMETNSRRLVWYDVPKGINPDFINLCLALRRKLGSDLHADMLFVLYGYDGKAKDLSRIFSLSQARTTKYMNEIHEFWRDPENASLLES